MYTSPDFLKRRVTKRDIKSSQGVSSHGKPGKVMEFHFIFPGVEKSWKLTPGFGKFIKSHGN